MKKLITSIFTLFIAACSIAQSDTSYIKKNELSETRMNRVQTSLSMGAGLSFLNSGSSSTFTFIAPVFQYQLTPKFKLSAGLIHYNVTGTPFITKGIADNKYLNKNKTYSGNIIQVGGLYQLNERVTVSGSVLYQVNPSTNYTQANFNITSLGLDYKVTPRTTLSFKANVLQGTNMNSLYYSNPLGPNSMPFNGMQQRSFNTYSNGMFPSAY
jgi:hypothetical protein